MSPVPQPPSSPPDGLEIARTQRLHLTAQALLFDIARRVRAGYIWHVGGEVPADKILGLVAKLSGQHSTHLDRVTRHRNKAAGEAAAVLFIWPVRNDPKGYTTTFRFLLLGTENLEGERMQDGRHKPVRVNLYPDDSAEFHLVATRRPWKRGESRKGPVPVTWEWQLCPRSLTLLRARMDAAARGPAHGLQQLIGAYSSLPMTGAYRRQLAEVMTSARQTWRTNQTPTARALRERIKRGEAVDPLRTSALPFMSSFPVMYADPPETLADHLAAAGRVRGEVKRSTAARMRAMHAAPHLNSEPVPEETPE
ncbi:hypothetical protein [Deinococcus seoulensis]|nr:hypothetical protein [Deinococcus seoulensis]